MGSAGMPQPATELASVYSSYILLGSYRPLEVIFYASYSLFRVQDYRQSSGQQAGNLKPHGNDRKLSACCSGQDSSLGLPRHRAHTLTTEPLPPPHDKARLNTRNASHFDPISATSISVIYMQDQSQQAFFPLVAFFPITLTLYGSGIASTSQSH